MPYSPTIIGPSIRDNRIKGAIAQAAAQTGVDFSYLYNQAKVESGLNPAAHAKTSSATGLYQFTRQTWIATLKQHGAEHGLGWAADAITKGSDGRFGISDPALRETILDLREQPEAASSMAAEFASDNSQVLEQRLNREVEPADLYLAHFLGAGGATQFLKAHASDPSAAAAKILPAAAAANRSIFYAPDGSARSLAEIRSRFADKFDNVVLPNAASQLAFSTSTTSSHLVSETINSKTALSLRPIEPMPTRLSLDFARRAYVKLAGMTNGSFA
jgi:Transglycosylase SLT domain